MRAPKYSRPLHFHSLLLSALFFLLLVAAARGQEGYQRPPKAVTDILDALPPPLVNVNPSGQYLELLQPAAYPSIADLAEPMLRLAGHRINPQNNGPARSTRILSIVLVDIGDGKSRTIALPAEARPGGTSWSPNGKHLAFYNTTANALELWIADVDTAQARKIPNVHLNAAYGQTLVWMPDSRTVLCRLLRADRGQPPAAPRVPTGPTIQESSGKEAPVRTYQDLLKNRHDEELFDYYFTAQLALVDSQSGAVSMVGKPGIFSNTLVSPDGNHILVAREHRPYSYLHPSFAFPKEVEVWNRQGDVDFKLANLPLADQVPIEGVPTGPRQYEW